MVCTGGKKLDRNETLVGKKEENIYNESDKALLESQSKTDLST